jgi:hypothetical protein
MSMFLKLTTDVTTVNKGAAVALSSTPLLGNASRKCFYKLNAAPLTSTCLIQTAPRVDSSTGAAPAAASTLWTTLLTLTSASELEGEITPDYWIRYNTTVLDADGPAVLVYLKGVQ